jgi:hypothetical protein
MTGSGSYDWENDRFVLDVRVDGVEYRYVRVGEETRVRKR